MPELPEVETTRLGLLPYITLKTIFDTVITENKLRWPISKGLEKKINGLQILDIQRRSKYLIFEFSNGYMLIHLGMSGRLAYVEKSSPKLKHTHFEILFENGHSLRYTDPRRFGAILWVEPNALHTHPLLAHLGIEPLEDIFDGKFLHNIIQNKKTCIKALLMNAKYIVGIGNIYAQEALFLAGILPTREAKTLNLINCNKLVSKIKFVLNEALKAGGTSFRDFVKADGRKGYFQLNLWVYGRNHLPCKKCGTILTTIKQLNRTTHYCSQCQV